MGDERYLSRTIWRNDAINQGLDWNKDREQLELIAEISQSILEGMAHGRLNDRINDAKNWGVLGFTGNLVIEILTESQEIES